MTKKWIWLFVIQLFCVSAKAQLFKPAIHAGTTFYYTLDLHGQQAPFELSVTDAADSLTLEWKIRRLAGGLYKMTPAARQNGSKLNFAQPVPNVVTRLSDHETFLILSKTAFKALVEKQKFQYDYTTYVLKKDDALKIGDATLDALHVVAQDETTELWILNDPDFPVVCKVKNNPMGVDLLLTSIK